MENKVILGEYAVGDIVVSLETWVASRNKGDMFRVLETHRNDHLCFKPGCFSANKEEWRLATAAEEIAFNNGIKNIYNMQENKKELNFEKGKWYLYIGPDNHNYYLKCSSVLSGKFYYSDYIRIENKKHILSKGSVSVHRYITNQEVSLLEIQAYLPAGHPDKIVSNNIRYSPGDIVVCLPEEQKKHSQSPSIYGGASFKPNFCFNVDSITNYNEPEFYQVLWGISKHEGVFNSSVRPATQKEKEEYYRRGKPFDITDMKEKSAQLCEKGQWRTVDLKDRYVLALKNSTTIGFTKKGKYLKITESFKSVPNVVDINNNHFCFDLNRINEGEFELMPEGFIPNENVDDNLVGRYLLALVDKPQGTFFKKGAYVKIVRYISDFEYGLENSWYYSKNGKTGNEWKLMPEGFVPENKSDTIIQNFIVEQPREAYPIAPKQCFTIEFKSKSKTSKILNTFVKEEKISVSLKQKNSKVIF